MGLSINKQRWWVSDVGRVGWGWLQCAGGGGGGGAPSGGGASSDVYLDIIREKHDIKRHSARKRNRVSFYESDD